MTEPAPHSSAEPVQSAPVAHEDPTPPDARRVSPRGAGGAEAGARALAEAGIPEALARLAQAEDKAAALNAHGGELSEKLGIEYLEASAERVIARMPVEGNRQPVGLLHGGATISLAESLGSMGSFIHGAALGRVAVGLEVSATHHSSARSGWVVATAEALQLGRSVATYEVTVRAQRDQRRISTIRVTCFLKEV
ncbi:PaaI family thioesterase [Kocuria palustris]|uniref:PaaI family thioesterase n=1 Tax=Kocuria palustris TaxID=71999 RepID=UPI0011AA43BC|nr:PaaI family thioesterase [Kocuria palustris]